MTWLEHKQEENLKDLLPKETRRLSDQQYKT